MESYIEYIKNPSNDLVNFWESNIKPFILKKYPFQQDGIFNINADIKYLIQIIDNSVKKENNVNDIQKYYDNEKNHNEEETDKGSNKINYNSQEPHSSSNGSIPTNSTIFDEINSPKNNIKIKEITENFHDEFETEGASIMHKKFNKQILSKMTYNLFLKKIVIKNFLDNYIMYATNFAEQCFYFMKKDIVFKKAINCYKYYTQLKVPFNQRINLIYFINILIIKMYSYYDEIDSNDEILILLKEFYNNFMNELKQSIQSLQSNEPKTTGEKVHKFIAEGINTIKQGVNNINMNIKDKIKNHNNQKSNTKKNKNEDNTNSNININSYNKEEESKQKKDLLNECEKIIVLFDIKSPKSDMLLRIEKSLHIYILKVKFKIKINGSRQHKKLTRSSTQVNYFLKINEEKKISKKIKKNFFYCLEWNTSVIGEELIYVSQIALNSIKRKELYNGEFYKTTKYIKCPGIMDNINKFNRLILFIIEDILSYDFPKIRAKVLEKWANVAAYCLQRKDYNDVFAINSALKNYIILGLDLTWKELKNETKALIKDIDNFCTLEGNYKNIREDMKLLSREDFYTPYLGLLLKDLNFYEENYKYLVNGNLINFDKVNGIQSAIDEFFHFQKTIDTKVTILPDELRFFEFLENKNESELEKLAQKLEPEFTLFSSPKSGKRYTVIDKKYFKGHCIKNKSDNNLDIYKAILK